MVQKKKTPAKKASKKKLPARKTAAKPLASGDVLKATPRVEDDVLSRRNSDGSVAIMRLDNDEYFFTLDGIAAEIWGSIDGKKSCAKIHDTLLARHRAPEKLFNRDFSKLMRELVKEKLIRLKA